MLTNPLRRIRARQSMMIEFSYGEDSKMPNLIERGTNSILLHRRFFQMSAMG